MHCVDEEIVKLVVVGKKNCFVFFRFDLMAAFPFHQFPAVHPVVTDSMSTRRHHCVPTQPSRRRHAPYNPTHIQLQHERDQAQRQRIAASSSVPSCQQQQQVGQTQCYTTTYRPSSATNASISTAACCALYPQSNSKTRNGGGIGLKRMRDTYALEHVTPDTSLVTASDPSATPATASINTITAVAVPSISHDANRAHKQDVQSGRPDDVFVRFPMRSAHGVTCDAKGADGISNLYDKHGGKIDGVYSMYDDVHGEDVDMEEEDSVDDDDDDNDEDDDEEDDDDVDYDDEDYDDEDDGDIADHMERVDEDIKVNDVRHANVDVENGCQRYPAQMQTQAFTQTESQAISQITPNIHCNHLNVTFENDVSTYHNQNGYLHHPVYSDVGRESDDEKLTASLTAILDATCHANDAALNVGLTACTTGYRSQTYPDGSSSIFFSLRRPDISLHTYISRLVSYLRVSRSVFVVALVYLDRVHRADVALALTHLNVHRLLTTALVVAAKFVEDEPVRSPLFARIGGVPSQKEMNVLEAQFLRRLAWNCTVPLHVYSIYAQCVLNKTSTPTLTTPPKPTVTFTTTSSSSSTTARIRTAASGDASAVVRVEGTTLPPLLTQPHCSGLTLVSPQQSQSQPPVQLQRQRLQPYQLDREQQYS